MNRKISLVAAAGLLTFSILFSQSSIEDAKANSSLQNQISDVQKERQEKQQEKQKTEAELKEVEKELGDITAEIERLDKEVEETSGKIQEKREEIEEVQAEIEELKEQIEILEERIAERDELLKDRARAMYQNGGSIDYLEVILGAKSFGDFLDRVSALSVIAEQDRGILEAHIEDHRLLEEAKAQVEEKLETLEGHLVELENLMAQLEEQQKEKEKVMGELASREDELHGDLESLENDEELLRQQEKALQEEYELWKKQEEERKAAEKAAAEAAAQQAQASSSGGGGSSNSDSGSNSGTTSRSNGGSSGGGGGETGSVPSSSGSGFMRPATGDISSPFGYRTHPVTGQRKLHAGIDIRRGNRSNVPVVAAYDGTVVQSTYSSGGYGNMVIIAHSYNGRQVTTLYAHLETRSVSAGQRVSKGQTIGIMGNTGLSTGPHLHFEVHEGSYRGSSSAVNPMNYIN
ncbi:peptidoglycan DD-metalloendopeptidase family protein [Halalkalibacterium halodurans]|uniref:Cell wall-binding protein n=1 Tax=Halalkalibacterium halodurans (strain ATCC BAA-125 / DSM 18197 / FERM 7344 / JCM 9153 / C-125) TaxID=272558 RepID=Q9K6X4_HALH5|nr:peptidoglycan DD-metalloendopeptidase family protein [Halalkalibacterium halodurans]MED4172908.1 peptidoglycan DD-metalloendopeptidase family protein [Halalkalibacterium halodurans]BAB07319.1 cell wall-binding protein [Halalkalibacterium halodurans C-125]